MSSKKKQKKIETKMMPNYLAQIDAGYVAQHKAYKTSESYDGGSVLHNGWLPQDYQYALQNPYSPRTEEWQRWKDFFPNDPDPYQGRNTPPYYTSGEVMRASQEPIRKKIEEYQLFELAFDQQKSLYQALKKQVEETAVKVEEEIPQEEIAAELEEEIEEPTVDVMDIVDRWVEKNRGTP